jgi:peptide/nickel transport system ATP-binding protein
MADAEPPLLVMTQVARRFGSVRAVEDASLAVLRGTTLGVLGESGSGKSTLARLATGLVRQDAGEILYDGAPMYPPGGLLPRLLAPPPPRRRVAMVFQDAAGSLDPRWGIGRSISEPIVAFGLRTGRVGVRDRAIQLMATVGLPEQLTDRRPHELSLGQLQRAAVARALAGEPELLVCDEPTSALDISVQAQVLNALREAQGRTRLSMLFISHDIGVVRHMADLLAVMLRGRVVEFGLAADVFARPRHPYTRLLLASEPDLATLRPHGKPPAAPEPLPPVAPGLCAFQPRCKQAVARCAAERPPLVDVDGVAVACHAVAASA